MNFMPKQYTDTKKDLAYYLTLFTVEGHTTWRTHLAGHKNGFDEYLSTSANPPKVTAKRVVRIDRITGEFSDIK